MEVFASIGLMWILKYGSILSYPREYLKSISDILKELFDCSMCLGFWCGIFFVSLSYKINGPSYELILIPFISSASCWFLDSLLDLIQESSVKLSKANK